MKHKLGLYGVTHQHLGLAHHVSCLQHVHQGQGGDHVEFIQIQIEEHDQLFSFESYEE